MIKKREVAITRNLIFSKTLGVGTGLGLSVSCFIIVKNYKGSMAVESSRLGRAEFIIHLPEKVKI
ncbi:MAG: hypothetical protein R6U68_17510 [Desulfobacteraceae bacterium]